MPETPIPRHSPTFRKYSASSLPRLLSLALVLVTLFAAALLAGKERPKYALIYGSVFDDQGFALRGARIVVTQASAESARNSPEREKRRWVGVSDARGEFAIRVPAGKGNYAVGVEAAGFSAEPKTVEIKAEERVDVLFRMVRVEQKK